MEDVKAFASLSWQMYTDRGVTEVKTEDGTCLFLKSGMVRVYFPEEGLCQEPEKGCYMIRCTLKSSSYDIPPKVSLVRGIFAEVCQRDTKSAVLLFQGERKISAEHFLFKSKEFQVFVEEEPEKFYLWEKDTAYQWEEAGEWGINLTFPRAPQGKQVMVICLEEEIMPFRNLGILYGYDNQEFFLPPFSRVYGGDFSLLIEERGEDGRIFYHKVFPECSRDGEVCYTLEEESGKITVTDCGGCEGARVLLGDYSLYQGGEGCAVKGAGFTLTYREKKFELENCLEVLPGKFGETMEEVHKRFLLDLRKPYTMVTAQDCQYLVKNIPGLSVDKAGVLVSPEKNEIKLVVKPNSREFCPRLSSLYKTILCNYLEKYRILNTKISVEGPKYVPIHVHGAVVVKKQYEKGEETVKDFFYDILDGTGPKGTFGGTLSFHKIYHGLGKLACVAEIRELSLRPGIGGAETQGLDICLAGNALYYPGEVDIEFSRT